jgi:hypothetical protein
MNVLDADFKDRDGNWVLRFRYAGKFIQTRLGRLHNNLVQRANKSGAVQNKFAKAYNGVSVSGEFLNPQLFCDWAVAQKGWGLGYHLDKDLLQGGNRLYCPNLCVFLPKEINYQIRPKYLQNGRKLGVYFGEKAGKFFSALGIEGKDVFLGCFKTEDEAHEVYCKAKENYVKILAEKYKETIDGRAYDALMSWKVG